MKQVRFPIREARSYLVIYQENDTGDKLGMYVKADDEIHAKKIVALKTKGTTVLDAKEERARERDFI